MHSARAGEGDWPGPLVVVRYGEVVPNAGHPARTETEWFRWAFFKPEDGLCRVELRRACCDTTTLTVLRDDTGARSRSFKNVAGMAWITNDLLVFAASDTYGKAGLYTHGCVTGRTRVIVKPKSSDLAIFELHSVLLEPVPKIRFYYTPTDQIDFNNFRTAAYLFEANVDGSGFTRVAE